MKTVIFGDSISVFDINLKLYSYNRFKFKSIQYLKNELLPKFVGPALPAIFKSIISLKNSHVLPTQTGWIIRHTVSLEFITVKW